MLPSSSCFLSWSPSNISNGHVRTGIPGSGWKLKCNKMKVIKEPLVWNNKKVWRHQRDNQNL